MNITPGAALRDRIARALAVKHVEVKTEYKLIATTADVFFVDDTNHVFPQRIAIEAKDWNRPLTSSDIARIDNLYRPSIASGEIDGLWIIGQHTLASSPQQAISALRKVKYNTFAEFSSELINFHSLLEHNIGEFQRHEASSNFITTRERDNGKRMDDVVDSWIQSSNSGLIIYGGYGLGKTTYSIYLAKRYSEMYLSGRAARIPVRITLGRMYTKHDLKGLICSELVGGEVGVVVPNFSFNVFLQMSQNGQFLVILDGFDEMRHAMDLDDFIYTFEQMRPLFLGDAKVIILGRPDSFLSNREEERVLSSMFDTGILWNRRIVRVEVGFLNKNEIRAYLDNHIKNRDKLLTGQQLTNYGKMLDLLPDDENNILARPVQLNMFTKIMEEALLSGGILTRYQLYLRFIYGFIRREQLKIARKGKKSSEKDTELLLERAAFMQDVAWWVLTVKKENKFIVSDIPDALFPSALRSQFNSTTSAREALVGSVIEPIQSSGVLNSKAKKYYYFPHKSYIEFLITEYFVRTKFTIDSYRNFMGAINAEVLSFLEEREGSLNDGEFIIELPTHSGLALLREGLGHMLGSADARLVASCAMDPKVENEIKSPYKYNSPADIYVHYAYISNHDRSIAVKFLFDHFVKANKVEQAGAILSCMANEFAERGDAPECAKLFVHCFTDVFLNIQVRIRAKIKQSPTKSTDSEPIILRMRDRRAVNGLILNNVFSYDGEKKLFRLSIVNLGYLSERISKQGLFVTLVPIEKRFSMIEIDLARLRNEFDTNWVPIFDQVSATYHHGRVEFPIRFVGAAEDLL